jgi:hypothetical protein
MTARKEPGDDFQPAAAPTKRGGVTEDEKGVRRDGYGRYMLPECTVGKARKQEVPFTRATTFAKSISDTYALSMWQQRMTAIGIAKRQDLRLAAATLHPTKDKDALNGVVEQAKEAAAAKSAARIGSAVHAFTEAADRGEELDAQEYAGHVDAYTERLTEFGLTIVPDMIERIVVWNKFSIAGTFDRVAYWQGRPIVLDLKTGRDLQSGGTRSLSNCVSTPTPTACGIRSSGVGSRCLMASGRTRLSSCTCRCSTVASQRRTSTKWTYCRPRSRASSAMTCATGARLGDWQRSWSHRRPASRVPTTPPGWPRVALTASCGHCGRRSVRLRSRTRLPARQARLGSWQDDLVSSTTNKRIRRLEKLVAELAYWASKQ